MSAIDFVRPMKAKQTNRMKCEDGTTRLRTAQEMIEWVGTLDSKKWVAEIKWNGQRGQFQSNGWWTTRPTWVSHEKYSHICDHIPSGCVIDGELMPNDGEGHEVVSHYRAACPHKLKLIAFDILYWQGESCMHLPWEERRALLEALVKLHPAKNIKLNPLVHGSFSEAMKIALEHGHEGLIIKDRDSVYKPGSRSRWLKCKATETIDVVITDCDSKPTEWRVRPGQKGKDGVFYPKGRHSDPWLAGHVGLSYGFYDKGGVLRRVGSLGKTGTRQEMKKFVGRVAEVASFGPQFPTGAIQHPTLLKWRDDKDPRSCVFEFEEEVEPPFDPMDIFL